MDPLIKECLMNILKIFVITFLCILSALIFLPNHAHGQQPCNTCPEAIEITSLPFTDSWCLIEPTTDDLMIMQCNDCGGVSEDAFTDPDCGCWHSLTLPRWFTFTTGPANGPITMNFEFDLCSQVGSGNCGNMLGYYALFNQCPESGGTILSYPVNGNNPAGNCWDEFGGNPDFILESCFFEDPYTWPTDWYCMPSTLPSPVGEWTEGEPSWNFPSTQYWITFDVQANTQYWICVFPSGNCGEITTGLPGDLPNWTFGCIDFSISGPIFLSEVEFQIITDHTNIPWFSVYPQSGWMQHSFDLIFWQDIDSNRDLQLVDFYSNLVQQGSIQFGDPITVYYRATDGLVFSNVKSYQFAPSNTYETLIDLLKLFDTSGRKLK